jgi:hypothetical protein
MYLRRKLYRMFLTLRVNNAFKARAAQLNATPSSGRIVFVGQVNSGEFSVEYHVSSANTAYVSHWPGWAFELAKAALLYDKEVWVLSNGDPLGDNLVEVLILR